MNSPAINQSIESHGQGTPIVDLVIEDILIRKDFGAKKYGEPLKAFNGRSAIADVYQEALDMVIYLRQMIEEDRINVQNR